MKFTYKTTIYTSFISYIVQAVVNNFAPLLFLTFQNSYGIPLSQITILISINFIIQLLVDAAATLFLDKIGYRIGLVSAHICAALGLISMTILPDLFQNSFAGLVISVMLYAIGGGLIEVIVSPVVEACPYEHKEQTMSILHSFYCWGCVGVVVISTLFFCIFGISNWKIIALIWSLLPVANALMFTKVPLAELIEEGETALPLLSLLKNKLFLIFLAVVLCAGASEQVIAQWSSTFVEKSLGLPKTIGDLLGPAIFAVAMGTGRSLYGTHGHKIDLEALMIKSGVLCIFSYLLIALIPIPAFALIGTAVCGAAVAILWPGTYSLASANIKNGGSAMFALLALSGDLGCSVGPTVVGAVSGFFGDNLKLGTLAAIIFPLVMLAFLRMKSRIEYGLKGRNQLDF